MGPSLPFPAGANASDTYINSMHYNLTVLRLWNYTYFSNRTLSNESKCWLVFDQYRPLVLSNGTFINGTSCYSPIGSIEARGITGLVFGVMFAATIVFTMINLRKHGRTFLPRERRWSPVGRRWRWYWMLFVAACGAVSTITGVDVDRDYLQGTALTLQSFFYTLMMPGLLACVWEATRHWGSWQERQICDADPFLLSQNDRRSRVEFYMPLVFYLLDWLVFFMTIPRSWTAVQKQGSIAQAESVARPMALDARFKAGSGFALMALILICYSLHHSVYYYKQTNSGRVSGLQAIVKHAPQQLLFAIFILATKIGYTIAYVWDGWSVSPFRIGVNIGWLYGLGYGPALLVLILFNIYGFLEENEDRVLIGIRARREEEADHELGITRASLKPSWWSKSHTKAGLAVDERLKQMSNELNGRTFDSEPSESVAPSSTSTYKPRYSIEEDESGQWWWQRRKEASENGSQTQVASSSGSSRYVRGSAMLEAASSTTGLRQTRENSDAGSDKSARSLQGRPQVVRSMLDV